MRRGRSSTSGVPRSSCAGCGTTRAVRARRCGRTWPSSAGWDCRCPRPTVAAASAWWRPRFCSTRWAARPIPGRICRPCSPPTLSTAPAPRSRRTGGCPPSPPEARGAALPLAGVPVGADAILGTPGNGERLVWELLRRAAVAAAAEMLGAARRCLDMSVGYAKVREQFGQPIGSFQAIRHKCAEMLLSVENSHAAVYYAAWALDAKAEDAALAASVAKSYVSEAERHVCGEAIQVHGGIGFTWEYDLHLYMKPAKALEPMYGDADWHREQILRLVTA